MIAPADSALDGESAMVNNVFAFTGLWVVVAQTQPLAEKLRAVAD